ncbi:MAG: alginate lyase family protein, partial [Anaerolineales bacterium]|nr:alginate lyase family protein [Anaerolineales bacterium]
PSALADNKMKFVAGDKLIVGAVDWLLFEAGRASRFEPVSVMDKKIAPPSNDKHDYMSMAPYWWPNPNTPNGLPYVRKDGQTNPELHSVPDKDNMNSLSSNAYTLALAYYFTGDEKYAAHAAKLIRVWFLDDATRMNPNMKFGQAVRGVNDGRAEGVLETRTLSRVVDAVGLIAESKSWTTADQQGLTKWFGDYVAWMIADPIGKEERAATNNHGVWYDAQLVAFLLFTGKNDDAKKVLEDAKRNRIAAQIEPDGKMPLETSRADGWHYTVFNLSAFFALATLGDRAGVDLWNYATPDGRGIRRAFDYLVRFIVDEKWPHSSSANLSWSDIYNLMRQAAVKYGAINYQQISARIPTVDAATTRLNILLPPFVASAVQTAPTLVPKPTVAPLTATPLVICNFEDDIAIWQGYDQGTEVMLKAGETPPPSFISDTQVFAAALNRWYQPMPGFESSAEQVKEGKRAGKWANVAKNNRIVTDKIPHDWSAYQYLSFWVYSAEANKTSVTLVAHSETEPTQQNYFNYKITLDWTGWKLFQIGLKEFTVTRAPVGWHKIDSLKFASSGWSQTPYSTTVLYFDAMKLINDK